MARGRKPKLEKNQSNENSNNLNESKNTETVNKGRKRKKVVKAVEKSEIWNINSIISKIFGYFSFKDLVKFNTVCKRWNQLTNPIIHRKISLLRSEAIQKKAHSNIHNHIDKIEAEIDEFIANNAKHAQLFKEFVFNRFLIDRVADFFETFKFITVLKINSIQLSEFEFMDVIRPLDQLQELNLYHLSVYRNPYDEPFALAIKLPKTLTDLTLCSINADYNTEAFLETINSHTNLFEFKCISNNQNQFLDPFYKNYPTLKMFEFSNGHLKSSQSLCSVFECNPQLLRLKLELSCWNSTLGDFINRHLNNLEDFALIDKSYFNYDISTIDFSFTQSTKIKILSISWAKLAPSSVESILLNCPDLEVLTLKHYNSPLSNSLNLSLNLFKSIKIKNLSIDCNIIYKSSFESLLLKCPHIEILDIQLPVDPDDFISIVGTRCPNIKMLKIYKNKYLNQDQTKSYYEELYTNSNFKTTLTHLTLKGFGLNFSAAENFEKFAKLKTILFVENGRTEIRQFKKNEANKTLWPNFNVTINVIGKEYDVVLTKHEV
jgi:hypothetical protein